MASMTRDTANPRSPLAARVIWALALPAMLTNIATALFGLADMWVIGRLGDAAAQGGWSWARAS
jgi:MATE family multidrug resistance protein